MQNRRRFLQSTLALPAMMGGGSMLGTLAGFNAQAFDRSGYRALVCVFLFGGMDGHDTVLPFDTASYDDYGQVRSDLLNVYAAQPGGSSRLREALLPLETASASPGGREFALPPQLAGLHQLFGQGRAAVVGNVGPLIEPTDRAGFINGAATVPARLFSHNDQQSTWMSFAPEGSQIGWGGRFGDTAFRAGSNAEPVFSQISLSGNSVFLTGDRVSPFQVGTDGVPAIQLIEASGAGLGPLLRDHFATAGADRSNLFERDFVDISRVTLEANDKLESALQGSTPLDTAFPASGLGAQLQAVATGLSLRESLGMTRQVFFVSLGGFDTHSAQANTLPALQQDIGDALAAFYAATEELGIADQVTTFTAADFGRTLTVNGDGTDHGWGSHHFVVGGAVKGGDIYGDIPVAQLGHDQDAGNGRLIPTLSVEQFAEPLGRWFGLSQDELHAALPNLANFSTASPDFI
jgi:uncharacterized protein (DUF1501 family)